MKHPFKVGLSFGLTSGIITTLGLIVGLQSGTHSKLVVIGGILTIAIADAFSDALGIHISEESENKHNSKEIWEATISTFLFKFFFALTFIIPILFFELSLAVIISVLYGLLMISFFSFNIARKQKRSLLKIILEHLIIAISVIITTYYAGKLIPLFFE